MLLALSEMLLWRNLVQSCLVNLCISVYMYMRLSVSLSVFLHYLSTKKNNTIITGKQKNC